MREFFCVMKKQFVLLSLVLTALVSSVSAASIPAVDVTVSNASGKLAYKGKTNGSGGFATGEMAPGAYVVQFNSKGASGLKGNQYAIVVGAGKTKVSANGVAGEKFSAGGVAMKIEVGPKMKITGQIVGAQAADKNIKIINGKRYVWAPREAGSNLGGRWVEEGSPEASNVTRINQDGLRNMQDRAQGVGSPGN